MPIAHEADPTMTPTMSRRRLFERVLAVLGAPAALALQGCVQKGQPHAADPEPLAPSDASAPSTRVVGNRLSLAQWSLHRMHKSGQLDPMAFPAFARETFGFNGVEYVNQFYMSMPRDGQWVKELRTRAEDAGVASLLIMVDSEGALGDPDAVARVAAVEGHRRWLDAAAALGCHSIRVNALSVGTPDEQRRLCADGTARLCEYAAASGLAVIIENHGGISCDGAWVASIVRSVGLPNCGTLPDFGNFRCADGSMQDRYLGVEAMMPFARAVSAKSHDFAENGEETATSFERMLRLVAAARYEGWIGVEYEGKVLSEVDGVRATSALLERYGCRL